MLCRLVSGLIVARIDYRYFLWCIGWHTNNGPIIFVPPDLVNVDHPAWRVHLNVWFWSQPGVVHKPLVPIVICDNWPVAWSHQQTGAWIVNCSVGFVQIWTLDSIFWFQIKEVAGNGPGGLRPTQFLAGYNSNRDVINIMTSSLLHKAHPVLFCRLPPCFKDICKHQ